jgi:hypothetical protein
MEKSPYLSGLKGIGNFLNVSTKTVERLIKQGLPVKKIGWTILARKDEIEDWIGPRYRLG